MRDNQWASAHFRRAASHQRRGTLSCNQRRIFDSSRPLGSREPTIVGAEDAWSANMSPESSFPNLARDLVRIHRAISRGLSVSATRGAEFIKEGFPDVRMRQGYLSYVQALTIVLGAHHLGEDEIAFPALRPKLPAAPYERLAADHHAIDTSLVEVRQGHE